MNLLDYFVEFKFYNPARLSKVFFFHPNVDVEGSVEFNSSEYGALSFGTEEEAVTFVKKLVEGENLKELTNHAVGLINRLDLSSGDVYVFVGNRHNREVRRCVASFSFNVAVQTSSMLDPRLPPEPEPEKPQSWVDRLLKKVFGKSKVHAD